jgi:small subunit ribosomal protein S17
MAEEQKQTRSSRRQLKIGKVVSDKMDKTVVVAVSNSFMDPLYKRHVKRTSRFYAHDEENQCRQGDRVQIVSSRPLSSRKRWRVRKVLLRGEGS